MSGRMFLRSMVVATAVAAGAGLVLAARLLDRPDVALLPPADAAAGLRFQQSLAQLLLRQGGLSQRSDPVVVTAPEINAFLTRHVEARRLALWPVVVRLEEGWLEVAGRTSPRRLLSGGSATSLVNLAPDRVLDLEMWLVARGRLRVRDGTGEFLVDGAAVGRQAVVPAWLWALLGVRPSDVLAWQMPRIVERIEVAPARLVLYTRRR